MTDDQKDNKQSNNQHSTNATIASTREVNVSQISLGNDKIKGKKTDIQNPELWDFPMNYPMSIIGNEGEHVTLLNEVKLILGSQFPDFDLASMQVKPSKTGRFHSIRVNLYLTTAEQVNTLYASLDAAKTVRIVM